ncbi:hypothetical protein C474_14509 [Halogeometricum pallidum JCM 14848]|uniref:Uncharacterized protein n=1 Tax=Halogeometricum pallidum JCM 14848 TaxID=1227487 RepID=M0CZP6_HALPD|nr:DUF6166 domain-containing protein [Halogeometricum pallidum]ELZ28716.1 hypothetical protein C474_14509 [Halogeometricum pallidum JCM 14848]
MSGISEPQAIEESRASNETDVIYVGYRQRGRAVVEKYPGREPLTPDRSLKLADHSPSGFEWGYAGSGPAQLALALLLDYTDDEDVALAEYMAFKDEVVSRLECSGPKQRWRLTGHEIDSALRETVDEPLAPSVS